MECKTDEDQQSYSYDPFKNDLVKTDEIARSFSVDLVKAANEQLAFLRAAHHAGVSLVAPSRESWRRYEECWLPMLATLEQGGWQRRQRNAHFVCSCARV